jgi:hypothetical protein
MRDYVPMKFKMLPIISGAYQQQNETNKKAKALL